MLAASLLLLLVLAVLAYRRLRPAPLDPLAILPPGAGLLAGADLERLRQLLFVSSLANLFLPQGRSRDEAYDHFVAETGFAIERDVDRVTLALVPARPRPVLLVVLEGRFPSDALVRYALTHGAQHRSYRNREIYRVPLDSARELWFAPLNEKVFLVANSPALEAALDRALTWPHPDRLTTTAGALAAAGNTVWAVAEPKLWPDPSPIPRELRQTIELAWLEAKLGALTAELKITANCRSEAEAAVVESNVRGLRLVALGALAQQRPRDPGLEKLAQQIEIRRSGSVIEVGWRVGVETLRQWLTTKKKEPARSR